MSDTASNTTTAPDRGPIEHVTVRETTPARRFWTPAEDALVLAEFAKRRRNWPALLRSLPGRSRDGVIKRAQFIEAPSNRVQWTKQELATLAAHWGEDGRRTIMEKLPGRSWPSIVARVQRLGLPLIPQGWVTVSEAARQTGFAKDQLRRVIAWANGHGHDVVVRVHSTSADGGRRSPRMPRAQVRNPNAKRGRNRCNGRKVYWRLVQLAEVLDAVEAWMALELLPSAARRLGVIPQTLRAWMREAGHTWGRREQVRRDPAVYDAVARAHGRLA